MTVWRLAKGKDRRIRQGYPWVFASELASSAREIKPGALIELRDSSDHFLAYGYGHPSSQICFRRLSSLSKEKDILSERFFIDRLQRARELRLQAGVAGASHRWLFAESDGVPGLIVDAFLTTNQGWVVVVQASTAGIENALPQVYAALETFAKPLGLLSIVESPSSQRRKLEGLEIKEKRLVRGQAEGLSEVKIRLRHDLQLHCDLLAGQKTGFFLDQQWNASLLRGLIEHRYPRADSAVQILDICCYVGQWSAHAAHALKTRDCMAEVTLVDASEAALSVAEKNLTSLGAGVKSVCGDALIQVGQLTEGVYDLVICDPPAFVKKKADLEPGRRAYIKLMRDAMRAAKPGALFVASSCSGLVGSDDWRDILVQASAKAGRQFKQLLQGGHPPDHPVRPEFPEGEYLKCNLGRIDYPY